MERTSDFRVNVTFGFVPEAPGDVKDERKPECHVEVSTVFCYTEQVSLNFLQLVHSSLLLFTCDSVTTYKLHYDEYR